MAKANADVEILEFAISREVEAYRLFLALSRRVSTPAMRKVFEDLAKEELEHKAKLELEMMKMGRAVDVGLKPGPPDSEYIVSNTDAPLDMDYRDMLLLGMEKEEASFRTYVNLLPGVEDEQSRELLLALAEEEVKHKLRFQTEYELLLEKDPEREA